MYILENLYEKSHMYDFDNRHYHVYDYISTLL